MRTAPEPDAPLESTRVRLPRAHRARFQPLPLPFWLRVGTIAVGWILVVVGIAGLFLPILQGGLSLILGFALLSIASQTVHLKLRSLMGRWPRAWRRLEKLRRRMHAWLHRLHVGTPDDDEVDLDEPREDK